MIQTKKKLPGSANDKLKPKTHKQNNVMIQTVFTKKFTNDNEMGKEI